jgi:protein-S-isoprenylcysteine O-methyltransferase Ste14
MSKDMQEEDAMGKSHPPDHDKLAGEHAVTDGGQLILLVVFLGFWVSDSFVFRYSVSAAETIPRYVRLPVAAVILFMSAYLALRAHKQVFGADGRAGGLITSGVFSLVRHPMYLGSWLFFCGLVCATLSCASAAVVLVMAGFYYYVARYEERLLIETFGADYQEYRTRVPMVFPLKLGKRKQ